MEQMDSQVLQAEPLQYRKLPYTPFRQPVFTSKSKYKQLQKLKLLIGAIVLFPIRFVIFVLSLSLGGIFASILVLHRPRHLLTNPADIKEDSWLIIITNRLIRLGLFALGLTNIEFRGKVPVDYTQDRPWLQHSVICAPHTGTFDWSMIVSRATRLLSPVIKAEIGDAYGLWKLIRLTMPVLVSRDRKQSRTDCLTDMNKRQREGFKSGWFPLMCFPEGTNGNRKQLLKFKPGPFIAGKPVIPVLMSYTNDEGDENNDLCSWPHFGRSVPLTLFLCMCRLQTTIVYTFLDTYTPTLEEQNNPNLYAENVRQVMSKELKKNVTEWMFEDALLMRQAQKAKLQPEIGAIKLGKVFAGVPNQLTVAKDLLAKYLDVVNELTDRSVEEHDSPSSTVGIMPVVEKEVLLRKLFGKNWRKDAPLQYTERLPSYVSFEQLSIVHAKTLTQKIL